MGKIVLVMELNKYVIRNEIFICGKYDYSKSQPYSALVEVMNMFCDTLALEDEYTIGKYRALIKDAVEEEGKLRTNIIKNLKDIIGE